MAGGKISASYHAQPFTSSFEGGKSYVKTDWRTDRPRTVGSRTPLRAHYAAGIRGGRDDVRRYGRVKAQQIAGARRGVIKRGEDSAKYRTLSAAAELAGQRRGVGLGGGTAPKQSGSADSYSMARDANGKFSGRG